ncbi:MAG: PEGA domain-containing protein [Myxococcales bacterium]|nr:MAG: PEGA domain-containing protein [Myxococcales bacterium]
MLVLQHADNPQVTEAHYQKALESIQKTLSSYGHTVLHVSDRRLKRKLSEEDRRCTAVLCADDAAKHAGADAALSWTLWSQEAVPTSIALNLTAPSASNYAVRYDISGSDIATAAREACKEALSKFQKGSGPFIKVDGTHGARLLIDTIPTGILPYHKHIEPGEHHITVELNGYETFSTTLTIPKDKSFERTVSAKLEPIMETHYPWLMSGVLVGAGAALSTLGIIGLAKGDSCTRSDAVTGDCLETSKPIPALAWTSLGLGAASITAGIVWFFIGQYQTRAPTEKQTTNDIQVRLSPTSIELAGTF